jgi:MFS family permease
MSLIVQGFLLGRLLKRFSPRRLAVAGLMSSTVAYVLWGAASQGWMMYAVIFLNVLGFTITAAFQSIISGAASPQNQGQILGAVSSLNSLMAVVAPRCTAVGDGFPTTPRRLAHRSALLFLRPAPSRSAGPGVFSLSQRTRTPGVFRGLGYLIKMKIRK